MKKRQKPKYPKKIWSDEDKKFLKENYDSLPMPEIMDHLIRTDVAIHRMATVLKITGNRFGINNYKTGNAYKDGGNTSAKKPVKKIQPKPERKMVAPPIGRKRRPPRRNRWCDQRLTTKPFTGEGQKTVRIDHKTIIYVPANASPEEMEKMVNRYKNKQNESH